MMMLLGGERSSRLARWPPSVALLSLTFNNANSIEIYYVSYFQFSVVKIRWTIQLLWKYFHRGIMSYMNDLHGGTQDSEIFTDPDPQNTIWGFFQTVHKYSTYQRPSMYLILLEQFSSDTTTYYFWTDFFNKFHEPFPFD